MRHVIDLCNEGKFRPDVATLDCGSLNFGDSNRAYISTPNYLRQGAAILRDLKVKAELEIFDTGNLWFSRMQMPWVAQSILLGGNVRVGLEDNLYLSRGVYASNAQLVTKARTIIEAMGARIITAAEARDRLKIH